MSQSQGTGERGSTASGPPSTPRWVKVFGIIFIVLVVLAGIILITGIGGEHGPGRHMPSEEAGETPLSSIMADGAPSGGELADQTWRASVTERGGQQP